MYRAYGMLTGDKDHQDAGNLKTEEATWKKAVLGEGELPQMGSETIKGKVERLVGRCTLRLYQAAMADLTVFS